MRLGDSKILTVPWPNIEWWNDLSQDEKQTEYTSIHSPLKVTQEFIDILDGRQIPPEPQENIDRLNEIKSYLAYRNDEARYCKDTVYSKRKPIIVCCPNWPKGTFI